MFGMRSESDAYSSIKFESGLSKDSDAKDERLTETSRKYFVRRPDDAERNSASVLSSVDQSPRAEQRKRQSRPLRKAGIKAVHEHYGDLVEVIIPSRSRSDLILSQDSVFTLTGVADEFRRGDDIRRHGLPIRSKLLFCGPPGCGKTLCAEVVAAELQVPLVVARLDAIIASHLGETAANLRKVFEIAQSQSIVLFLDEFDAIARTRTDATEHSEIRRVVNSLLMMIDRFEGRSLLIAATNLEHTLDRAIWRRFDEVVLFEKPTVFQIRQLLQIKTRNFLPDFDIAKYADKFQDMAFSQIERACINAIRSSILQHRKSISEPDFRSALEHEIKRSGIEKELIHR